MRDQIARIIADCPDTSIDKIGDFWRIRVERHCDTGRNGIAVAEALMKRWRWDKSETLVVPPQPLTTPLASVAPEANYTAIKESLRSEMHAAEPEQVEVPMFLQAPPAEVSEVLAEFGADHTDSYERVNGLLVTALTTAKGSAELARTYGGAFNGKSVVEWERKAQAINESIRWNAGRRAETI